MPLSRFVPPRLFAVVALAAVALAVGGCQAVSSFYPPAPVTAQGAATKNLYDLVFALAVVVFLGVEALIIWTVVRYRRKPTDTELPPQVHGNNTLEVIWTAIPTVIVGVLFFLSWNVLNTVDARSADADQVWIRAEAARFQWTFQYLDASGKVLFDTSKSGPEMTVPAGQTVHLLLSSKDVTHSFYVPQFLFKRDVIPGRDNWFDFKVDAQDAGQTFRGQCAQLCGTYHSTMLFTVKALSPADFAAWVGQQTAEAQATPSPAPSGAAPSGSAAPSGAASSGATPSGATSSGAAASPGAAGTQLTVTVQNETFGQTSLSAPANTPFTIQLQNNDAGVPHDIVIHDGTTIDAAPLFEGEIFSGVDSRLYPIPALKPGTYLFSCKVHPNMTGTLTVQ